YALWPLAVVHGVGAGGKDASLLVVQAVNVICVAAVLVAVWRRVARRAAVIPRTVEMPRPRTARDAKAGAR
ncbi:MAG: hypothetical protein L0H84_22850, partial [Pseudonocardia sp.]|nr:hypothetical protein [Pseudonocardia sp.]